MPSLSFFEVEDDEFNNQPLASRVRQRLGGIKLTGVSVKNTIQVSVSRFYSADHASTLAFWTLCIEIPL